MKKDCDYTRKNLRKYLRGHLFKYEQIRIARHLNACALCRSEFQALKKVADTKQLLRDITPPEGLGRRMKAGLSGLLGLKVLLYRPLWLAAILAAGALVYINLIMPNQRDIEIENIEKSLPSSQLSSAPTDTQTPSSRVWRAPGEPKTNASGSQGEPLMITITAENQKTAMRVINEVMEGQSQLGKIKFSDTARAISGTLTAKDLLTFLGSIEQAGKVSYSRKRFESFPPAQPIPFVMKMKQAPKIADNAAPIPASKPVDAAASLPASAPTQSVP
jgi:hypothetical protein